MFPITSISRAFAANELINSSCGVPLQTRDEAVERELGLLRRLVLRRERYLFEAVPALVAILFGSFSRTLAAVSPCASSTSPATEVSTSEHSDKKMASPD